MGGREFGGGGVKLRRKQDAVEKAAFCELSTHYWGFGNAVKMTALGTFLLLTPFLVPNMYRICAAHSESEKPANK